MRRRALLAPLLALSVAGCGSGSASSTATVPRRSAAARAYLHGTLKVDGRVPLTERVLPESFFPRLRPLTNAILVSSPRTWAADEGLGGAELARASNRLRKEGFLGGTQESLSGQTTTTFKQVLEVRSAIERFRSPSGVAQELRHREGQDRSAATLGGSFTPFRVPGVPGAQGYTTVLTGNVTRTILFTDGHLLYVLSAVFPKGQRGISTGRLAHAAARLYARARAEGGD